MVGQHLQYLPYQLVLCVRLYISVFGQTDDHKKSGQ